MPSVAVATDDEWDELARQLEATFVVVVRTIDGEWKRRRCFFTVKAAQDAAWKATRRGEQATVMLAQLVPVYRLPAGGDR